MSSISLVNRLERKGNLLLTRLYSTRMSCTVSGSLLRFLPTTQIYLKLDTWWEEVSGGGGDVDDTMSRKQVTGGNGWPQLLPPGHGFG